MKFHSNTDFILNPYEASLNHKELSSMATANVTIRKIHRKTFRGLGVEDSGLDSSVPSVAGGGQQLFSS